MSGTPFNILGMGWALPKTVLDNDFLHQEVGLKKGPDFWGWCAPRLTKYWLRRKDWTANVWVFCTGPLSGSSGP